ncbi:MAG: sulfite exporter TauE/SafE family protein [Candidatus Methanoperedens sp.]|nr:sulfite exporter TauE/SafE family protein [Candidatus Methanoperedens sp.]MCE8427267.1 sulfite exporter TauE/SafE family protein [Candidatus Methanoperedens sp.]
MDNIFFLSVLIFSAGLLYSSVGHAGASGYLAAMALFGLAPDIMKPAALVLNILVAIIATLQFYRSGYFSWNIFWPFAVSSIPFAFIGGALSLPGHVYKQVLGLILLFAAYRLFQYRHPAFSDSVKQVPVLWAVLFGAGIGLLSGAVGVGGGIFLSPLLLFMGWARTKETAGVSAAFILVNSIAGIAGHVASVRFLPDVIYPWAFAAMFGGIIGSHLGSRRFVNPTFYRLLAIVLIIAGAKLIFA